MIRWNSITRLFVFPPQKGAGEAYFTALHSSFKAFSDPFVQSLHPNFQTKAPYTGLLPFKNPANFYLQNKVAVVIYFRLRILTLFFYHPSSSCALGYSVPNIPRYFDNLKAILFLCNSHVQDIAPVPCLPQGARHSEPRNNRGTEVSKDLTKRRIKWRSLT